MSMVTATFDFTAADGTAVGTLPGLATVTAGWIVRANQAAAEASVPIAVHNYGSAHVRVEAVVSDVPPGAEAVGRPGIGVRVQDSGNWYALGASTNRIRFMKRLAGSITVLGDAILTLQAGTRLRLIANGTTVSGYYQLPAGGDWLLVGSDATGNFATETQHGLVSSFSSTSDPTVTFWPRIDDLSIADLSATASPPNTPSIAVESVGTTTVDLSSSAFSDPNATSTHAESRWQVTTPDDVAFDTPIHDSGSTSADLTTYTATGLPPNTELIARVGHSDDGGLWSEYSDPTPTFQTAGLIDPGTIAFISTGPAGITIHSATAASGGIGSLSYQWRRSEDGGAYSDLVGKTAADLGLDDTATTPYVAYRYRRRVTDSDSPPTESDTEPSGPWYVTPPGAPSTPGDGMYNPFRPRFLRGIYA
jgi:hypothetical protein